jgi:hypothetical protein
MTSTTWTAETLEQKLDGLGYDFVGFHPGGEIEGSTCGGKPVDVDAYVRARRRANGASLFAGTPEKLFERIEAYEQEHSSRGLTSSATVAVSRGLQGAAPRIRRGRGGQPVLDLTDKPKGKQR